jgi:hypothetical protein
MHTSGLRRRGRAAAPAAVPGWGPSWSPSCGLVTGFAFTRRWLCRSDRECDEYHEGDSRVSRRRPRRSDLAGVPHNWKQYIDRWPIHLVDVSQPGRYLPCSGLTRRGAAWVAGKADTAAMCGTVKRRFVFSGRMLPPRRRPSASTNCNGLRQAGSGRATQRGCGGPRRTAGVYSSVRSRPGSRHRSEHDATYR